MLTSKEILVGAVLYFIFVPIVFFIGIITVRSTPVDGYGWLWGILFVLVSLVIFLVHPFPKRFREVFNNRKNNISFPEVISSAVYFSLITLAETSAYGLLLHHYHASLELAIFVTFTMFVISLMVEAIVFYYFIYPKKPVIYCGGGSLKEK